MKNYIFLLIAAVTVAGCTKDLKTYDGKPVVYFQYATETVAGRALTDSTIISFAYSAVTRTDSIIALPIKVTGLSAATNRTYQLAVAPASTATSKHYEFVNTDFTIGAGKYLDTVYIKLHRTTDMLSSTFVILLNLQANENFGVDVQSKLVTSSTAVSTIIQTIKVNDILKQPKYWLDYYLGPFSRKKLYLMSDILGITIDKLDVSASVAELVFYGKFMQRYLNEQKAAGTPILEDDGTPMTMGPGSI